MFEFVMGCFGLLELLELFTRFEQSSNLFELEINSRGFIYLAGLWGFVQDNAGKVQAFLD